MKPAPVIVKTTKVRINSHSFALLMKELWSGGSSIAELHETTGLAKSTLYDYIRELRKTRLIHIVGYERASNNCPAIPVYQWGPYKPDAKVPKLTSAERAKRYRSKKNERDVLERLTLLGSGAGPHAPAEGGGWSPTPMDRRPDHGEQPMV